MWRYAVIAVLFAGLHSCPVVKGVGGMFTNTSGNLARVDLEDVWLLPRSLLRRTSTAGEPDDISANWVMHKRGVQSH